MQPYLQQAVVTLVPLKYESGTRFKIIESGAASVPCISTTLGAEGLSVTHGKDILIADETNDFVNAIVQILNDPQLGEELGRNLRALVEREYNTETQAEQGREIINYLHEAKV